MRSHKKQSAKRRPKEWKTVENFFIKNDLGSWIVSSESFPRRIPDHDAELENIFNMLNEGEVNL
jgi:hypothetical protein